MKRDDFLSGMFYAFVALFAVFLAFTVVVVIASTLLQLPLLGWVIIAAIFTVMLVGGFANAWVKRNK